MSQKKALERWQPRLNRSIAQKTLAESDAIKKTLLKQVRKFAKAHSYNLVLNKSTRGFEAGPEIPGGQDTYDLTYEVRKYLEKKQNSEQSGPDFSDGE